MSDDIVTRLRQTKTVKGWYDHSPDVVFKNSPLCYEAADEIENLRAELKEFSSQYQQLKRELETYKDLYAREAVEKWEKNG